MHNLNDDKYVKRSETTSKARAQVKELRQVDRTHLDATTPTIHDHYNQPELGSHRLCTLNILRGGTGDHLSRTILSV